MIQEIMEEEKKSEKNTRKERSYNDAIVVNKVTDSMVPSDEPVLKVDESMMVTPLKTYRSFILNEDCISLMEKIPKPISNIRFRNSMNFIKYNEALLVTKKAPSFIARDVLY